MPGRGKQLAHRFAWSIRTGPTPMGRRRLPSRLATRDRFRGCTAPLPCSSCVRSDSAPNCTADGFPNLPSIGFGRMVQLLDQARLEYEARTSSEWRANARNAHRPPEALGCIPNCTGN